jgi:hypothetical protein
MHAKIINKITLGKRWAKWPKEAIFHDVGHTYVMLRSMGDQMAQCCLLWESIFINGWTSS